MSSSPASPFWDDFEIEDGTGQTLQDQVSLYLRNAILNAFLRPGMRLPSTRTMARDLGVSRQTVVLAYERLSAEGYLAGRTGSGTYVSDDYVAWLEDGPQKPASPPEPLPASPLSKRGRRLMAASWPKVADLDAQLLATNGPSLEHFPWSTWHKAGRSMTKPRTNGESCRTSDPPDLRRAVSDYVALTRGIVCEPEQVIITSGSRSALDLIARVILDPGDAVWIEDPILAAASAGLFAHGVRLFPVPVDCEGLNVRVGEEGMAAARAAVVSPSHQFPLAVTMSLARRKELLTWAERSDAWIIEDDLDCDFRYSGRSPPTVFGLSAEMGERVIYLSDFSRVLARGFRIGFMIVPPTLVDAVMRARIFSNRQVSKTVQAHLASFIVNGHLAAHRRVMRNLYLNRRDALFDALSSYPHSPIHPGESPPNTGLHMKVDLYDGIDVDLSVLALGHGIRILPLSGFYRDREISRNGLVLGFSATKTASIKPAVDKLMRLADENAIYPA